LNCYISAESRIVDKYYYMADGVIVNMKIVNLVQSIYSPVLAVGDKILTLD